MNYDHEIVTLNDNLPARYFYSNDQKPNAVLPHFHGDIEIMYVLTGCLSVTFGIESCVLFPGDIKLFHSNEIHSSNASNDYTTAYVLQISTDYFKFLHHRERDEAFSIPLFSAATTSATEKEQINQLKQEIELFFATSDNNEDHYNYILLQSHLCKIVYLLYHFFADNNSCQKIMQHKDFKRITEIDRYMKVHYAETISLSEIAAYMGLTDSYFSKYFSSTFGVTFSQYLCSMRLEHAYNDLITTDYPILHISEKNGFANYQLFSIKFKETYGCTPSLCRQKYFRD